MRRAILLVLLLTLPLSVKVGAAEEDIPSIIISEIFVSPNSMTNNDTCNNCYGATDWNGDGKYGRDSDQFIEITNTGDTDVDISDWWLDDSLTAGSPGCRIGWNTTIFAGESISFYVADTGIRLSYYDGGPINLLNSDMIQVATFSFPAKDSWYGKSYVPNATSGGLDKVDPTPADFQGRCYNEKDTEHQGSFWLKGRVVTMVAENEVFNNGAIKVVDGRIAEVGDASIIPANESIPIHESDGTIYPGLIDMHNHLHYNQVPLWDMDTHLYPANRNQWGGYQNRYQWGDNDDYSPMVTKPRC